MLKRALGKTGLEVSILSFGASSLGGVFREITRAEAESAVRAALDGGINFIDVSPAYGETLAETNLGFALQGIPRERYYLATKVGSYSEARGDYDYGARRTTQSVHESLARLGVDYVDVIQCHDIEFAEHDVILNETLPALEKLKKEGLVRHIGITGLPLKIFHSILDRCDFGQVETALSFCHYELNDNSLIDLLPYFESKGVGVINASPTGMGLLTERGAPKWHPASESIRAVCRKAVEFCRERGEDIVKLAMQFSCANERIATTLFSTTQSSNVEKNLRYVQEPINEELLDEVLKILKPIHRRNFTRGLPVHRDPLI